MGGSSIDDDRKVDNFPSRTVVLLGRTGNGKSATGNSILGGKFFDSKTSSSGVTSTCEQNWTQLQNGRMIHVIDTPGLFEFSAGSKLIGTELVRCMDLAKYGIHAIIVVFSVRTRFSQEEEAALCFLQEFFGEKILDYMIVVFTGGDELEESNMTMEDYLGRQCPPPLMDILALCENRYVVFDNKTKDETKKAKQCERLFSLIDVVLLKNGRPYTNEISEELQKEAWKLQQKVFDSKVDIKVMLEVLQKSYEKQLEEKIKMVELKLKETTFEFEKRLEEEKAARREAEKEAQSARTEAQAEMGKLREDLEKAQKGTKELPKNKCVIL